MVSSPPVTLHDPRNGRLRNIKLYANAGWEYLSPANVATSTHSSRLKLRETQFIVTKTCDFLQIANKTIQIMIQFDQKGQPFTVRVNTLFLLRIFFNNK
jgi:hypothetical protein